MSFNVSTITDYVAANERQLVAKAILKGKTAGLVDFMSVVGESYINLLDATATLQDGTACGFNAAGSTAITRRKLVTAPIKLNETLCDKDLRSTFANWGVQFGIGKTTLPFEEVIIGNKLASVNKQVETLSWQAKIGTGSTAADKFDGFIALLSGDTSKIDATNTGLTLLLKPIEAISLIVKNIPADIIDRDDLVVFVGYDVFRAYVEAVNASNNYHVFLQQDANLTVTIPGTMIKLIGVNGLTGQNKAYASYLMNFVIGGDVALDSATNKFDFWYSKEDQIWKLVIEFNMGCQVKFVSQIVSYLN